MNNVERNRLRWRSSHFSVRTPQRTINYHWYVAPIINYTILSTLRKISGTNWLTCVNLALGSRLTQIFRSIDPSSCCQFSGQWPRFVKSEIKTRIYPKASNSIECTIEKCRFESPLWHFVFMEICLVIFYSNYIVMRGYICTPCWLCMFWTYRYCFIWLY